jgi:hydroxylamine reductase
MQLADKVVDAVKTGAIRKFFVMAGCDGRMKSRDYYTEFAEKLPTDTVILTAGCAKYRYNKLAIGRYWRYSACAWMQASATILIRWQLLHLN